MQFSLKVFHSIDTKIMLQTNGWKAEIVENTKANPLFPYWLKLSFIYW